MLIHYEDPDEKLRDEIRGELIREYAEHFMKLELKEGDPWPDFFRGEGGYYWFARAMSYAEDNLEETFDERKRKEEEDEQE